MLIPVFEGRLLRQLHNLPAIRGQQMHSHLHSRFLRSLSDPCDLTTLKRIVKTAKILLQCLKFLKPMRQHLNCIIINAIISMIEQFIRAAELFASRSIIENVYIHLPFCRKKCHFCAFPVHAVGMQPQQEMVDKYVRALKSEIVMARPHGMMVDPLRSIYFGGGTPSLHPKSHILSLLQDFSYDENTEITVQVNPTEINSIKDYLQAGATRISLGLQSFNSMALNKLGRHTDDSSRETIEGTLIEHRPGNLSVDFILNLCIEDADWREMLLFIERVMPEHLTIYFLEVNEGSLIHDKPQLISHLPQEETVIVRFLELCEILAGLGYDHYEVSNFSRGKKHRSVHSSTYWQGNKQYLAFGMGATSLISGKRITRPRTLNKYMKYVAQLKEGAVSVSTLDIAKEENAKEILTSVIMSGIRTTEGISWVKIREIGQSEELQERIVQCILEIDQERPGVFNIEDMSDRISLVSPLGLLLGDQIGFRLIQAIDKE